ncbi:MAG: MATE family efflux transporter, partial [Erysipelotrichia bacterium]|nr:MATE family efflux transporter [Erysipelotrichia bacterium]
MTRLLNLFRWQGMISEKELKGPIPTNKEIYQKTIKIAWPSALESVLIALISAVDTAMVGVLGKEAISAVGIVTQPKFIVLAPVLALNIGVTVLVARRKGEKNQAAANDYMKNATAVSFAISVILSLTAFIFAEQFLLLAGANLDYLADGVIYFRIILIGNVFYSTGLTITAAQRGIGNTKISMITNLAANGVNLVLNALLINGLFFFPKLGVAGAAIATSIGNFISFVIAVNSVSKKDRYLFM